MIISNTLGFSRCLSAHHFPKDFTELHALYRDILDRKVPFSVYSRGRNWGYGCHCPPEENMEVISLENLNTIIDFDSCHGLITIGPGVTHGQLAFFLAQNGDKWIAPVHGGGENCSVLGNALERGYGLTPNTDHFAAVNHLEAILADGSIYKSALTELGQGRLDKLFKYGIGPYFDGIFTQSGVGIVTQITIKLAQKPPFIEMFYFNFYHDSDLENIVNIVKELKRDLASIMGGINIINQERLLSMMIKYPLDKMKNGIPLDVFDISSASRENLATPWMVIGALYGPKALVKAAKKIVKRKFSKIKKRSLYFNNSSRKYLKIFSDLFPVMGNIQLKEIFLKLDEAYQIINGKPSNVALALAYWKNEKRDLLLKGEMNPTSDQCGLIWYAPLVEMKPEIVRKYVQFIKDSSAKFDFNALITLTTVDDVCFDSTIPLLYNKENKKEQERAWEFYNYLLQEGAKQGFFPYRLNQESQKLFKISNDFLLPPSAFPSRYR